MLGARVLEWLANLYAAPFAATVGMVAPPSIPRRAIADPNEFNLFRPGIVDSQHRRVVRIRNPGVSRSARCARLLPDRGGWSRQGGEAAGVKRQDGPLFDAPFDEVRQSNGFGKFGRLLEKTDPRTPNFGRTSVRLYHRRTSTCAPLLEPAGCLWLGCGCPRVVPAPLFAPRSTLAVSGPSKGSARDPLWSAPSLTWAQHPSPLAGRPTLGRPAAQHGQKRPSANELARARRGEEAPRPPPFGGASLSPVYRSDPPKPKRPHDSTPPRRASHGTNAGENLCKHGFGAPSVAQRRRDRKSQHPNKAWPLGTTRGPPVFWATSPGRDRCIAPPARGKPITP